jgi:nitroreductase
MDKYQERYLDHLERKKFQVNTYPCDIDMYLYQRFPDVLYSRRSIRVFSDSHISDDTLDTILHQALESPSSCNRQCIKVKVIRNKDQKDSLNYLFVGGAGWIRGADIILLLFADMQGYKSPNEVSYMPYLDAGVMAMTICYASEYLGLGTCIVNPNIKQDNLLEFNTKFNPLGYKFCLAIALGYKGIDPDRPPKIPIEEFLIP